MRWATSWTYTTHGRCTSLDQELMGFNADSSSDTNHMTYHHDVDHFTLEQLDRMHHFALQFRSYLIEKVELSF